MSNRKQGKKIVVSLMLALVVFLGMMPGMGMLTNAALNTIEWSGYILRDDIGSLSDGESKKYNDVTLTSHGSFDSSTEDWSSYGSAAFTGGSYDFESDFGVFTKIEIICNGAASFSGGGWNASGNSVIWTGASKKVTLDLQNDTLDKVIEITFTTTDAYVPVTNVTLNKNSAGITINDKTKLTATIEPNIATNKDVTWSVSSGSDKVKLYLDEACTREVGSGPVPDLTVYAKGIAEGSATVTVTSSSENKSASCTVTVGKDTDPTTVYSFWVGDDAVTDTKQSGDGWSYDPDTRTLTLTDFLYNGEGHKDNTGSPGGIFYSDMGILNLVIKGYCSITNTGGSGFASGIFSRADLTISGTGTLAVSAENSDFAVGINCDQTASLTINSGTINAKGKHAGIFSQYGVTINGGTVKSDGGIGITGSRENGKLTIGSGVTSVAMTGSNTATYFSVVNAITGTAWTDVAGTQNKYTVPVSSTGQNLDISYKNIKFPEEQKHVHQWSVNADGTEATIKCTADKCPYTTDKEYMVKIERGDLVYGDADNEALVTLAPGLPEEVNIKLVYDGRGQTVYKESETAPTAAGKYSAKGLISFTEGTGPDKQQLIMSEYEIKKADVTVTKAPEAITDLTFNGSEQELIKAGSATGGQMQYSLGKDDKTAPASGWSAAIPKGADSGTYYVWYLVAADDNHNDLNPICIPVTIKPGNQRVIRFKVVNGAWNDGITLDRVVRIIALPGTAVTLSEADIPEVGGRPNDGFEEGSWDVTPDTKTPITKDMTYTYTYTENSAPNATVTFKIEGGEWDKGGSGDITVHLTKPAVGNMRLTEDQIPTAGTKPARGFRTKGKWIDEPNTKKAITKDVTYIYQYEPKDKILARVTFKVVGGKWNDGRSADKEVILEGFEGETLKLAADQIPAVGANPDTNNRAGSWDVVPNTDTAIKQNTTYTYTYQKKDKAAVTKAPTAKTLTYNGEAQTLVEAGAAEGGTLVYRLEGGTYSETLPTGTEAGVYKVFYMVKGDDLHLDSEEKSFEVTIRAAEPETPDEEDTTEPTTPDEEDTTEPETPDEEDTTEPTTPDEEEPTEPTTPDQEDPTEPETPDEEDTTEPTTPDEEEPTEPTTPDEEDTTEPTTPDQEDPTEPTSPDKVKPDNQPASKTDGKVKTGDESNPLSWILLSTGAFLIIGSTVVVIRKRKE